MHKAIIALAPGQVGFYDEVSGIHLSLQTKEASVSNEANTIGLIKAVVDGKIVVVSGSLGSETTDYTEATKALPTYYRLLEAKKKKAIKEKILADLQQAIVDVTVECTTPENQVVEDADVISETLEVDKVEEVVDVVEEVVEEKPQPKKTRKKKTAKQE